MAPFPLGGTKREWEAALVILDHGSCALNHSDRGTGFTTTTIRVGVGRNMIGRLPTGLQHKVLVTAYTGDS